MSTKYPVLDDNTRTAMVLGFTLTEVPLSVKMPKITVRVLKAKGACDSQVQKFKELFPAGVEITEELCIKHSADFDWSWAAENLLNSAAWLKYDRACAPARAEYDRVCAPAWAEYERVRAPAWLKYDRARAPAWAEYERVCAAAWAKAYINQECAGAS